MLLRALKRLVNGYPQSPYVVSALSELGLIYQNLGKDDEALRYYKQVGREVSVVATG